MRSSRFTPNIREEDRRLFSIFPWYKLPGNTDRHWSRGTATHRHSQYNFTALCHGTNFAVFMLINSRSPSLCHHVREVPREKVLLLPPKEKKERAVSTGAPCHVKLRRDGGVRETPSFSSTENLESCNRATLVDSCEVCFPRCSLKHGEANFRKDWSGVHSKTIPPPPKKKSLLMTSFHENIVHCTFLHGR